MKISVVMQSYLGDYPGSRSRSEYKFTRAVHSFLSQTHSDKELVIVADGCDRTKMLYEALYRDDPKIKFAWVSPAHRRTYDIVERVRFFRGLPRQVGRTLATGDVVTYMDSDDIMLSNRLSELERDWSRVEEKTLWASNSVRFIHEAAVSSPLYKESKTPVEPTKILRPKFAGYDVEGAFWLNLMVPKNVWSGATYSLSHRRTAKSAWRDVEETLDDEGKRVDGCSEDLDFLKQLMAEGQGFKQESPSYVVCHYSGIWDV